MNTNPANPTDPGIDPLEEFDLDFKGEPDNSGVQNPNPTDPEPKEPPVENDPPAPPIDPQVPTTPPTEPEDDVTILQRRVEELTGKLMQYERGATPPPASAPQAQPQAQPQTPPTPAPASQPQQTPQFAIPQTANEITNVDFLGEGDHVDIMEDKARFNQLLNKVATVAFNAAVTASQERILRQIPQVVETTANQQRQIQTVVEKFYASHKDLEPFKQAVSMAAMQLHNENPAMPLEEILNKAAERTREVLRIRPGGGARPRTPAQPVGGGRSGMDRTQTHAQLSMQEQQIMDLISF